MVFSAVASGQRAGAYIFERAEMATAAIYTYSAQPLG
jgi:hypothetical protein